MNQLTPQMVFERERPADGFRQVSPEVLDRITARVYPDRLITSGSIEIPEGNYTVTRYFSHELLLLNGQRRTVTRSRTDSSRITVHGLYPDDPAIVAPAMPRVGTTDPDHLSLAIAEKTFSRQIIKASLPQRDEKRETAIPRSRDRINPDELIAADREISSSEWMMRHGIPAPIASSEIARRALESAPVEAERIERLGERRVNVLLMFRAERNLRAGEKQKMTKLRVNGR